MIKTSIVAVLTLATAFASARGAEPVQLTKEQDDALVNAGVLPPRDAKAAKKPDAPVIEPSVHMIEHAEADTLADVFNQMFDFMSKHPTESEFIGHARAVGDSRTNTLIFLADPRNHRFIQKMLQILDVPVEREDEKNRPTKPSTATE